MSIRNAGGAPYSAPPPLSPQAGIYDPGVQRWLNAYEDLFASGSPDDWQLGVERLRGELAPSVYGPAVEPSGVHFDALVEATRPGGALARCPQAHVALAKVYADYRCADACRRELGTAVGLARPSGRDPQARSEASWVNTEAGKTYSNIHDSQAARERLEIGRLYAATDRERAGRLPIYKQPPAGGGGESSSRRVPAMHAPGRPVPVPRELRNGAEPASPTPPGLYRGDSAAMNGVELAGELGRWADFAYRMRPTAEYIRALEAARFERDFYPAPLRPSELRAIVEEARAMTVVGSEAVRNRAQQFLDAFDVDAGLERAQAYWGEQ